jgi:pyruvate dehydrogenase E2 component (dihydrolipoamide acetyltransferase)
MISEVVMPQMGADMKEGTVLRWLKSEGEEVERGETIAEIETDKANVEIEAFDPGVFRKVLVPEGDTVEVGTIIAVIAGPSDDISAYLSGEKRTSTAPPPAQTAAAPSPAAEPAAAVGPPEQASGPAVVSAAQAASGERLRASPVARKLAQDLGISLATVKGTGPDGRIVRRDVEEASRTAPAPVATAARPAPLAGAVAPPRGPAPPVGQLAIALPAPGSVAEVPLSRMRQTIARRMAQSKREAPHYYLTLDLDMTEAVRMRAQINEGLGDTGRVSINDLIVLACTRALARHPRFNSWWVDEHLQVHGRINIGIAIALEDGLVAPAVLDCQSKVLTQISREARSLAERARSGAALTPEEYSAGTFTISNLGAFGVDALVAIINPPQTAILGVGTVEERAVVREGQVTARSMMTVALSADHRASEGAEGAQFLQTLREYLERPALMFV